MGKRAGIIQDMMRHIYSTTRRKKITRSKSLRNGAGNPTEVKYPVSDRSLVIDHEVRVSGQPISQVRKGSRLGSVALETYKRLRDDAIAWAPRSYKDGGEVWHHSDGTKVTVETNYATAQTTVKVDGVLLSEDEKRLVLKGLFRMLRNRTEILYPADGCLVKNNLPPNKGVSFMNMDAKFSPVNTCLDFVQLVKGKKILKKRIPYGNDRD